MAGQLRIRASAMVWSARLSARSSPRFRRCLTVRPLLAGSGLTAASAAKAASLRHRRGWEKLTIIWAALPGPMPGGRSARARDRWRWPAAEHGWSSGCGDDHARATVSRRISAWRTAWSRLASRGARRRARPARMVSVSAPRASWRSVSSPPSSSARTPIGLRGTGRGQLLSGDQQ